MAITKAVATETLSEAGGQGITGMVNALIDGQETTANPGHTHTLANGASDVTATAAELNIMDGVTADKDELNLMDGCTATTAELNKIDGFTGTYADLNYAKDLRATGVTAAEYDYLDGVTSAIQTQIDAKAPTANPEFTGDVGLATAGNIQANSVDPYKTISLDARAWQPTTTNGCATVVTEEAGTNDIDYDVLDFDTTTDENAFCNVFMPGNWDAGVLQFRYVWTNAAGLTTETVTFELSGRSYADNDAIDQAVGTAVEVADTWIAQGDIHISAWSGDVTITGAGAGEWVHFELMRDVSEDDMTGDARLIAVQIRYKESQYNHF